MKKKRQVDKEYTEMRRTKDERKKGKKKRGVRKENVINLVLMLCQINYSLTVS